MVETTHGSAMQTGQLSGQFILCTIDSILPITVLSRCRQKQVSHIFVTVSDLAEFHLNRSGMPDALDIHGHISALRTKRF